MMQLLIGGNGLIGTAVRREMERRYLTGTGPPFRVTTRRESDADDGWILYRLGENPDQLPPATVVYLVAAKPGFAACEGSAESWVVNVDAQIAIARRFKRMAFVVYVSSDAVELQQQLAARDKEIAELKAMREVMQETVADLTASRQSALTKLSLSEYQIAELKARLKEYE